MAAGGWSFGTRRRGAALLAGALLLAAPALRAEEAPADAGAEAPPAEAPADASEKPAAEPEAPPPRKPYETVGPSERRGRTFDPGTMRTETSDPPSGARTHDPDEHPGDARELDEVSRSPGPRPDVAEPPEIPAPLRLRRPLGEEPPDGAPLPERLCESERDLAHARVAFTDAVRAYKRARREEYPRGDAKYLVVEHRAIAQRRLRRAEDAHAALLAEAETRSFDFDPAACAAAAAAKPAPADAPEAGEAP
jgi:hypothetical protein